MLKTIAAETVTSLVNHFLVEEVKHSNLHMMSGSPC